MNKIRKSFLKRFKTTKKGKILRQITGQSHFFAKKSPKVLKKKKKMRLAEDLVLGYRNY
jgi:ribosomal protein L35